MLGMIPRQQRRPPNGSVARWWQSWTQKTRGVLELDICGSHEVERIAQDLGVSAADLRTLAGHDAGDADLLVRRMAALQLDPDEFAGREPVVFRDLQRLCTLCEHHRACAQDIRRYPVPTEWADWQDYCPNVATLKMYSALERCLSAEQDS